MTPISDHFGFLKAPLNNVRWSWGAVRPDYGVVILRVWQDKEIKHSNGKRVIEVLKHEYHLFSQGITEREIHLELLKENAICFLVMCEAKDTTTVERVIKDYNEDHLFCGGDLYEIGGNWFIERGERISSSEVRNKSYQGRSSNRRVFRSETKKLLTSPTGSDVEVPG